MDDDDTFHAEFDPLTWEEVASVQLRPPVPSTGPSVPTSKAVADVDEEDSLDPLRIAFMPSAGGEDSSSTAPRGRSRTLIAAGAGSLTKRQAVFASLTSPKFDPMDYLTTVHAGTKYMQLQDGLYALEESVVSQNYRLKKLVKEHLTLFLQCKSSIDNISTAQFEGVDMRGFSELAQQIEADARRLLEPLISRKESADRIESVLNLLQRFNFLFHLPADIAQNIKRAEYERVAHDFRKARLFVSSCHVPVFSQVLRRVEQQIQDLRAELFAKLQATASANEAERYISHLKILESAVDPSEVYMKHQLEALENAMIRVPAATPQPTASSAATAGTAPPQSALPCGAASDSDYLWHRSVAIMLQHRLPQIWKLSPRTAEARQAFRRTIGAFANQLHCSRQSLMLMSDISKALVSGGIDEPLVMSPLGYMRSKYSLQLSYLYCGHAMRGLACLFGLSDSSSQEKWASIPARIEETLLHCLRDVYAVYGSCTDAVALDALHVLLRDFAEDVPFVFADGMFDFGFPYAAEFRGIVSLRAGPETGGSRTQQPQGPMRHSPGGASQCAAATSRSYGVAADSGDNFDSLPSSGDGASRQVGFAGPAATPSRASAESGSRCRGRSVTSLVGFAMQHTTQELEASELDERWLFVLASIEVFLDKIYPRFQDAAQSLFPDAFSRRSKGQARAGHGADGLRGGGIELHAHFGESGREDGGGMAWQHLLDALADHVEDQFLASRMRSMNAILKRGVLGVYQFSSMDINHYASLAEPPKEVRNYVHEMLLDLVFVYSQMSRMSLDPTRSNVFPRIFENCMLLYLQCVDYIDGFSTHGASQLLVEVEFVFDAMADMFGSDLAEDVFERVREAVLAKVVDGAVGSDDEDRRTVIIKDTAYRCRLQLASLKGGTAVRS